MAKTKPVFYEYDPIIYPIKIWVSVNPHHTQVERRFYVLNENNEVQEFDQHILADDNCTIATTFPVSSKKDYQGGLLVHIYREKRFTTNYIAHESAHCADFFAEKLGLTTGVFHDGEAYAYLIGWIAESIETACKLHKKKKIMEIIEEAAPKMLEALEKIANPLKYLQEEAKLNNATIDGLTAVAIMKDYNFYQEIARKVLREIELIK